MRRRVPAAIATVALTITGVAIGIQYVLPGPAGADEITISQSAASRNGWDSSEPALSPATVTSKSFGQIFDTKVNGQVYAQPLVVGNSVLVATEDDWVYSLNRNTGAVNWSKQLGTPYAGSAEQCAQNPVVSPYIGVTSAPVYDPTTGTLYVSGMLSGQPGDDSDTATATPTDDLFALNESTGTINWHKQIAGSPTNAAGITFDAAKQLQRPGLLLLNGAVYLGFGALCADGAANHNYVGFIAGVNTTTQAETLWSDQSTDANTYGGIWQGGGGLLSDGTSIYFSTANGSSPPLPKTGSTAGSTAASQPNLGQSLVKLNVVDNGESDWSLQPADFFSPSNAAAMTAVDHDFGSGGPILLPFGTKDYPDLFITADKQANVYMLNEDNLGGVSSGDTGAVYTAPPSLVGNPITTNLLSDAAVEHGLWGHMAAFVGVGSTNKVPTGYIYYQGSGWPGKGNEGGGASNGEAGPMYLLKFDGSNPAAPTLENIGQTTTEFGFSSGSPVITSDGDAANSAIVWQVYSWAESGAGGELDAYSALPDSSGTLQKLWSSPIGDAAQFTIPATSDGRIYVGARNDGSAATTGTVNSTTCHTLDFESTTFTSADNACVGEVYGYGILSGSLAASSSTVNFGHISVGRDAQQTVTLTNTGDAPVKITKITTPSVPFGSPALPGLNQPIAAGATASIPVTFTPQARGTITGKYTVTTTDGFTTRTTTVTVEGIGAPPAARTTAVASPGGGWTLNGSSTMTGTTLQLTPAKASQTGSAIFYQPVPSSGIHAQFTARLNGGNGGDGMTFSLLNPATATTARGAGAGQLGYGGLNGISVVLGTRKDAGDPSANFVGIATGSSHGHLVFAATSTKVPNLRSGTHTITVTVSGKKVTVEVNGRAYVSATVAIPSTVLPAFTAANGTTTDIHSVSDVVIVTPSTSTLPGPGGAWSYNGTAAMVGTATTLTTAGVTNQAGSVVYPRLVSTSSFSATFDVALNGGTGGDGLTLALLGSGTKATSVGGHGTDIGFAGLNGLAVVLGTTPTTIGSGTSSDYAAVEKSTAGSSAPTLVGSGTDLTGSVNLRSGTHMVTVSLKSGTITVVIDGTTVLTQPVTGLVPSSAYVAFTGSSGTLTDRHLVQTAAITAG